MNAVRMTVLVLALLHAAFAGLTALVGAFADGGDVWSRLVMVLLHPLAAAGLLVLLFLPRPAAATVLGVAALLMLNVAADLTFAMMIARGAVKGDWWLPVTFSVVPAIGVVYAMALAAARPQARAGWPSP